MLKSFRQTVATPRKWPGRWSPSSPRESSLDVDPGLEAGRVDLAPAAARRGRRRPRPPRAPASRASSRGYAARSAPSSNCAGLTKRLTTTMSFSARAAADQRLVAGVQRPHRRDEADRAAARREVAPQLRDASGPCSQQRLRRLGQRRRTSARAPAARRGSRRRGRRRSPSRRARSGPVSSKPFSIVRRISGSSASGGAPAASSSEPAARRSVTR